MKKLLAVLLLSMLTACGPTVLLPNLPNESYLESCAQLEQLPTPAVLSTVATVVANNYSNYKKCLLKNADWIEWYKSQQKLYSSVTK